MATSTNHPDNSHFIFRFFSEVSKLTKLIIRRVMLRSVSTEVYTLISICWRSRTFFTGQPVIPFDANSTNSTTANSTIVKQPSQSLKPDSKGNPDKSLEKSEQISTREQKPVSQQTKVDENNNHELVNFRQQLDSKIKELGDMIETAQVFLTLSEITEAAAGHINNAVGNANLLITGKFKQFGGLCDLHYGVQKGGDDSAPPTYDDLQGFWEMIFISFEKIKKEFDDIELWKNNDWNEPIKKPLSPIKKTPVNTSSRPSSRPNSANSTKSSSKKASRGRNSSSALREQIKAARLAKKREAELASSQNNSASSLPETPKRPQTDLGGAGDNNSELKSEESNPVPNI